MLGPSDKTGTTGSYCTVRERLLMIRKERSLSYLIGNQHFTVQQSVTRRLIQVQNILQRRITTQDFKSVDQMCSADAILLSNLKFLLNYIDFKFNLSEGTKA